ncbi:polysialyltransferase family glycosyltransferase [Pontibacter flavimaris]|uniref:Uncharacterized protein n=1 Tax=Pontibacter flavimaris TaxID=1797110 RepID=A0A1Q5PA88_9BACT|nr:polysialyltransferase family glycosyltransferase [Pontibacter flavimaris]OKL39155.1 hypothetical protein A3841_04205 [Pontibacter flavimaris]
MKHIFYIHSYITYFVSLQVIKYLNLEVQHCVFLYGREFKPELNELAVPEYDAPFTHHPINSFAVERRFWRSWAKIRRFDAFVEQITQGSRFHFYTNQTGIDFVRLFLKHRKCAGFSILEEGLYSYHTLHEINLELCPPVGKPSLPFILLHYANFLGRLKLQKLYLDPSYNNVFGVTEAAFPNFERKVVLPFPFKQVKEEEETDEMAVLVFDSFLEYGTVSFEVFDHALGKAFSYFEQKGIKEVAVKYHPEQYATIQNLQKAREMINRHKGRAQVQELPKNIALERMASDSSMPKLTFYIFLSSAGLYAALCGRTTKSFAKFIADQDPAYTRRLRMMPKFFKELVQLIS